MSCVVLCSRAFAGPVFAPGSKLFVIQTAHFDIIFSEKSKPSALRLSAMADSVYDEVAGKLEAEILDRVPVVITPDIGSFNGYTSVFPYTHIILFDTSMDLGWTSFEDNLRSLFLHELTHAVSLGIRAPWAAFLGGVFGSWVLPGLLNTPEFMCEGVTVSFESADGKTGRANDPQVRERVRQDIRENRFKSPIEASGLYDEYPNGNIFYEYGGLFSAYLQKAYGMERYAALWKAMGNLVFAFTLDPYQAGFYKAFERTYGQAFAKAWADFRQSLQIADIVDPPEILGPAKLASISGGLAGDDRALFWVDARDRRAVRMDLATGRISPLFDAGSSDAITDAAVEGSPEAGRILVYRSIALADGRDRVETIAYDADKGRFLADTAVPDLREARFFRRGVVGIASRLHNTDLVYVDAESRRTLLSGGESLMFSSPAVLDDRRIALIVGIAGERRLGIFDADSGRLSLVKPGASPGGGDSELFRYVRQLSASGGKLYFNYDSDDRFYKLGTVDLGAEGSAIELETTDYSGGVFSPIEAGGRVYYIGRFSEGHKLCRYPLESGEPGKRRVAFGYEDFEAAAARSVAPADAGLGEPRISPYRPLAYANPFNMWFPYVDVGTLDRSFRPRALFVFQDPIDTNTVDLDLGYDSAYPFADASLSWTSRELPVTLSAGLGDQLAYGSEGAPERQSSASVTATLDLPLYPSRAFYVGLGIAALARGSGDAGSPYSWGYSGWNATASGLLGFEGRTQGSAISTSRGLDLMNYCDFDLESRYYKVESRLVAAYDRVPIRLELWGAWANGRILRLDSSSGVFSSDRRPQYFEYGGLYADSAELIAEGSFAYRLADQGIHADLLGLYFNRLLVDVGCRGAYYRGSILDSSFARLSLDLGAAEGMAAITGRVFAEGFVRLSVDDPDEAFGWRIGLQLDTDAGTQFRRVSSEPFGGSE